jgi:hypothetical protein
MPTWEYMELKITHSEVEIVNDDFRPSAAQQKHDPYKYVKSMIADGWQLVTRSGTLSGEFSVVLKRPLEE